MLDAIDYQSADVWSRLDAFHQGVLVVPDARCGYVRCEPGWDWQVALSDFDLWLAVSGSGIFELAHRTFPIRPGTVFLVRPGDTGRATQRPDDPLTVCYIHFSFIDLATVRPLSHLAAILPSRHIPLRDPTRMEMLLSRAVRLMQFPSPFSLVEARSLLHLAIVEVYRQDAENAGVPGFDPDPRVARVLSHIAQHPSARISLREAAALANLSPDHFSRLFRAHVGVSFRQHLIHARLERARYLLEETTLTIGDIAAALGYQDVFLFSRQFKARYHEAPSRLRSHALRIPRDDTSGPGR